MSTKAIYERFLWFHSKTRDFAYPNAGSLSRHFEISDKTAQRDIEFIRDRLKAPLEYDPSRRGYRYSEDGFELPGIWLDERELTSLLLAQRLLDAVPDMEFRLSVKRILETVLENSSTSNVYNLERLNEKVSLKNIEYARTDGWIFRRVIDALIKDQELEIEYYSPHKKETTRRRIVPLHLVCYMGSWHLIAHCRLRDEIRDFTLARISKVAPIESSHESFEIEDFMNRSFGIFSGENTIEVRIRFAPEVAGWVSEQVWHPEQVAENEGDGSLTLAFPVSDFTEIKQEILKFGSRAEVLAPDELRSQVRLEIEKMNKIYT